MKSSSLSSHAFRSSFLALVALALPSTANATLLVGWYDFAAGNDPSPGSELAPEAADVSSAGYSGVVTKGGQFSVGAGGSTDGTFGSSSFVASPGNDGYARVFSSSQLIFSLTNSSGSPTQMDKLFFDVRNANAFTVKYQIQGSPDAPVTVGSSTGTAPNFKSSVFDLLTFNVSLMANQTINFIFTSTSGVQIDNVAIAGISAIPEPASLLALGCVLGSGLMLRNRRIKPIQA